LPLALAFLAVATPASGSHSPTFLGGWQCGNTTVHLLLWMDTAEPYQIIINNPPKNLKQMKGTPNGHPYLNGKRCGKFMAPNELHKVEEVLKTSRD
jgi:hypothetical protein